MLIYVGTRTDHALVLRVKITGLRTLAKEVRT